MAIYKLFPEKDTTLYSEYSDMNTGIDPIIEITTANTEGGTTATTGRMLIQFNQEEIVNVINNYVTNSCEINLKLYMSKIEGLSQETQVFCNTVSGSWQNGTGMYKDIPNTKNGASWGYRTSEGVDAWNTTFTDTGVTGSWTGSNTGGGNWYTASRYIKSASLQYRSTFDLNFNITPTVLDWYSGSIVNNGLLIKQSSENEFTVDTSKKVELKYYSVDTNTIYPPELQIKWNDFSYITGSLNEIDTVDCVINLTNNLGQYEPSSIIKIKLHTRPQNPPRIFTTSSLYTTNYILPTSSYWGIKDLYTGETIVEFDDNYTKISCDSTGNYFTLYANGLQPERYYKILIKTIIDGNTKVVDSQQYFKIINS